MGVLGNCFEVNILRKLHVLSVDSQDLETTYFIGHTNVDLSVESTESTQGGVEGVRSVGSSNDDDMSSCLKTVHKSQKLGDHSPFNLTMNLLSIGSNGVDLIDEDDSWAVLFGFLKSFTKVALGLTGHLGHDFGAVDQEEESSGFIGDSSSNKSLS